jgi:hypothetical protein
MSSRRQLEKRNEGGTSSPALHGGAGNPGALPIERFRENVLACEQKSLRVLVEHWLAPGTADQVRVVEFRNNRARQQCYVRVELLTTGDQTAMFFFRHADGIWRVFPPARVRPTMGFGYASTH